MLQGISINWLPLDWLFAVAWIALCCANIASWTSNLLSLPGNWLILLFSGLFAFFYPEPLFIEPSTTLTNPQGIGVAGIAILVALALVGELVEFVASAAMAGKRGASRRAMALAVLGTMIGSILGALFAAPIPLLGPIFGALAGGAAGAFLGAILGELWKGKSLDEGIHVGKGALLGRLLGTTGKLCVGAIMIVGAAVDALY
jgi:uncharacterized protein YqgC (DUF456 family)